MSGFFTLGEIKERPGVYKRYENQGTENAGASEKIAACVVASNWGPINTPIRVDNTSNLSAIIGTGTGADVLSEIFYDGPEEAIVVRVGGGGSSGANDGACAYTALKAIIDDAEVDALLLTTLYPTDRSFTVTVRPALDDETVTEVTLYAGTMILESRSFSAENEIAAIVDAFSDSKYIKVVSTRPNESDSGKLSVVTQKALTGGANPTVSTAGTSSSYAKGFEALETEVFHYLCVDTNDTNTHAIMTAFIDRIYNDGAYGRCVIAEPASVELETRISHAQAFNNEKVIYVLNSWVGTNGTTYEGYLAAARLCGMLAKTPSNESLTHAAIRGAAELAEPLTNSQIKRALRSGCLVISVSKNRQVIIEKAINTLVSPATNQDTGWKKIKRVDVRFELMDRIEKVTDPMIGKVNNDTNGRAAVIAAAQRIIDAMIGEGKLLGGNCLLDTSQQPVGDSAWFRVTVDDIDALETIYLTFGFRFSQSS